MSTSAKRRTKTKAPGVYRSSSGRYGITYYDSTGRFRSQVAGDDYEAAKALRAELVSKMARGEKVSGSRDTFADVAEAWFAGKAPRLRPRTRRLYRDGLDLVLLPRFGRRRVAAVDADAIAQLVRDLERTGLHALDRQRPKRPLGHSAVTNYLKPLQGTLALAVRRGLIPSSPFTVLTAEERPKRGEPTKAHEWADEDVANLLAASRKLAARRIAKYDYSPALSIVSRLGLRLGEVLGLTWVDFERGETGTDGVLHIRRQLLDTRQYGPPKSRAGERRIALPPDIRAELITLKLASDYTRDDHPIFASGTGRPLTHRNLERRGFEAAREEAKLPGHLTLHDLRHAAASRLIHAGLSPVTVAAVLGHEDATTTLRIYAHLFDRQKTDEAVRKALAATSG